VGAMNLVLLTDFGERDGYAGVLRLVLQRHFPQLAVVDLSHGVEPGNILSAAWIGVSAVPYAAPGSVFCAVVDPGVGSERAVLVARWPTFSIVSPDNGLISLCVRRYGRPDCYTLDSAQIRDLLDLPGETSATFHGRDLFAPLAGALAVGRDMPLRPWNNPVLLPSAQANTPIHNCYTLSVLHWDHFGNAILDLHRSECITENLGQAKFMGNGVAMQGCVRTYSDVASGQPLLYWGSSGWLELAVRDGSARKRCGACTEPFRLVLP
jgi:S-adenosyl-L-methionine hydrolase (adenosine-forming)